jgi:hypothetical protein
LVGSTKDLKPDNLMEVRRTFLTFPDELITHGLPGLAGKPGMIPPGHGATVRADLAQVRLAMACALPLSAQVAEIQMLPHAKRSGAASLNLQRQGGAGD